MFKYLILITLLLTSISGQAKPLSFAHFSKGAEFFTVKLSPDGKYVAAITKLDDKNALIILNRKDMSMKHVVKFDKNEQVGDYDWVSNERIVLQRGYLKGWSDQPHYYGELMAVNADGSRGKYLMGYRAKQQTGTAIKRAEIVYGSSWVIDPLVEDEDHMLVATYPWRGSKTNTRVPVYKVDVFNGHKKKVADAPTNLPNYLTDANGVVRLAISTKDYVSQNILYRSKAKEKWQELKFDNETFTNIYPRAFSKDGKSLFVSASENGQPDGIYKFNVTNQTFTKISSHSTVEPTQVYYDRESGSIYAVEYEDGEAGYQFVDKSSKLTKRLKGLLQALPGHQVRIISSTLDQTLQVLWAGNAKNPGDYYLYDGATRKLSYMFSNKRWIDPKLMAQTKGIKFNSRDGKTIHGYLTLPNNKESKNLPLIVMPHGGPHGVRDTIGFESKSQMLANNGLAVLKVNFRGSGGYGEQFERDGHRKWGAEVQYDIIDGVKHLIEDGTVDKNNICIMGASFGGYSALQSSIIEPDLFKCAIGVVGVYDLPLMFEEGDIQRRTEGENYLEAVLGTDEKILKDFSPVHNIEKLKAPVLVVHGKEDERAPIEHAENLMAAMDKYDHPYEYLEFKDEGHGFYKAKHREIYYKKVISFLNKHLEF